MKPLSLYARVTALVMHLALIVALIWGSQSSLGLIGAFGLFLPLPGLLRGRERTHAWASMLLSFYCAALLSNAYTEPVHRGFSITLATLAAVEFSALVLYVRLRARELTGGLPAGEQSPG